jgi:hypothetical protein
LPGVAATDWAAPDSAEPSAKFVKLSGAAFAEELHVLALHAPADCAATLSAASSPMIRAAQQTKARNIMAGIPS